MAVPAGHPRGRAVQLDPMKPTLKAPRTTSKRLKLTYDEPLSIFAFNFNLRCYNADNASKGAVMGMAELGAGQPCSGRAWQTLHCPRLVIQRILNPRSLSQTT